MTFLALSFIAGALTVLAPCILPLLPVVVGSSAAGRSRFTSYIVVGSLALSVIAFTYLLKASTALIGVPPEAWTYLSGGILVIFGVTLLFPGLWERLPGMARLSAASNKAVGSGYRRKSAWGDVLVGAALGPVFSTCSPTYFVILASVLPASFVLGTLYLLSYVLGLSLVLLLFAVLGERFARTLDPLANPDGWFKRTLGALFILLGLMIVFGFEKKIESAIVGSGFFDVTQVEQRLLQKTGGDDEAPAAPVSAVSGLLSEAAKMLKYKKAPELVRPDGYLNTGGAPITIGEFKGKKVVLVDFWTYSCINCQRTLPYLENWYKEYEDDGLVIIGVHTPEFAFEHVEKNVEEAAATLGVKYPVVLDNEYATWNAFKNQFWPRKYLIDIDGYIVYDHAGEGSYDETEAAIKNALAERKQRLGMEDTSVAPAGAVVAEAPVGIGSPETYFGASRNEYLANGRPGTVGVQTLTAPSAALLNRLNLGGAWDFASEYASPAKGASVIYRYDAKDVYLVASADASLSVEVWQDGKRVSAEAGDDVTEGVVTIGESRLYRIIENAEPGEHVLELRVTGSGGRFYTFTFG